MRYRVYYSIVWVEIIWLGRDTRQAVIMQVHVSLQLWSMTVWELQMTAMSSAEQQLIIIRDIVINLQTQSQTKSRTQLPVKHVVV